MHRCASFGLKKYGTEGPKNRPVSFTSDLFGQLELKVVIFALWLDTNYGNLKEGNVVMKKFLLLQS